MLSDDPQPGDLPEGPTEPYAALRRAVSGGPPGVAGTSDDPGPAGSRTGAPAPGKWWWRTRVVAIVAVAALVVAVALGVWVFRPVDATPAATPTTIPSGAASDRPSPGNAPTAPTVPPTAAAKSTDHPAALDRFYTQTVAWSSCGDSSSHLCATVLVPVDYAKPSGDTFRLALRKVPATDPSKRVGSMLINPGGPGGSGLQYAEYAAFVFSEDLRASYDIIGFDPRGTGRSDAVACLTDDQMDLLFEDDPT
ncbi:MAG: alpha/beta hydrolase, partial [Intrasporangium sp.]